MTLNDLAKSSISLILMKLGTHDLCANVQKELLTDLWNFDFKIFVKFFKILHLGLVSGTAAAELLSLTGV